MAVDSNNKDNDDDVGERDVNQHKLLCTLPAAMTTMTIIVIMLQKKTSTNL